MRELRTHLAAVLLAVACCCAPVRTSAQAFPLYATSDDSLTTPTRETWVAWPFGSTIETSGTRETALHPLFSVRDSTSPRDYSLHILWPLITWKDREEAWGVRRRESFEIFPIAYSGTGTRDRGAYLTQYIFPFYWHGREGDGGHYTILFPFVWSAKDARLAVPLFPPRKQNISAVWPLYGDFRGYWNSDRFVFFLWPLFVSSEKGHGPEADRLYSFLWPLVGVYKGPHIKGFRLWPFYSHAEKPGQFSRSYWLWPLGHHRTGRISDKDPRQQDLTLFLPFYARMRRPTISYDMVFPFYGSVEQPGRATRGYAAALYNEDDDLRKGVREHRLLWFLIKWRTLIPRKDLGSQVPPESPMLGGGVFPFYTSTHNENRKRLAAPWPFYFHKWDRYPTHDFDRTYILPFYASQSKVTREGAKSTREFLFPLFERTTNEEGSSKRSFLHFWWYDHFDSIDRNYAPLWTIWEKQVDGKTGAFRTRVAKLLYDHEQDAAGNERERLDLLFLQSDSTTPAEGISESHTRLFWGLAGLHRRGSRRRVELFWTKL